MITSITSRSVQRSNDFQESSFKIAANGKAFKILSDGLYQDKIKAIIRELSCNAYDAHIEAKNESPFEIHLPTIYEPFFSIRDFGVGLSCNDVENVYTTYFDSTKTDSNDAIGCLGLGSKSPFSYVDSFTVISFFNNFQYTYTAFINESGVPSIAFMGESQTDEPNGLKIQFAVNQRDISEFKYKAEEVFCYFRISPVFHGGMPNLKKMEYLSKGDKWGISINRRYKSFAIMGNVSYPITLDMENLSRIEREFMQFGVDLFFDIGELEIAASREGLSYNDKTIQKIRDRINSVIEEEKRTFETELENLDMYVDAVLHVKKSLEKNEILKYIFKGKILQWHGQAIEFNRYLPKEEFEGVTIKKISKIEKYVKHRYRSVISKLHDTLRRFDYNESNRFFINDVDKFVAKRVKGFLESANSGTTVYLISFNDKALIEKTRKYIGIKEFEKLSSLPVPKTLTIKKEKLEPILEYQFGNFSDVRECWYPVSEDFEMDDGGFYVEINYYKVKGQHPHAILSKYYTICKNYLGLDNIKVYGVKTAQIEKFKKHKGWEDLFDFIKKQLVEAIQDEKIFNKLFAIYCQRCSSDSFFKDLDYNHLYNSFVKGCKSDLINKACKEYSMIKNVSSQQDMELYEIVKSLNIFPEEIQTRNEQHQRLYKEILEKFPLLQHINLRFNEVSLIKPILDYIEAITENTATLNTEEKED